VIHLPVDIVKQYYAATEATGACMILVVAQVRHFALNKEEAVLSQPTTMEARQWLKKILQPINDFCEKEQEQPSWRRKLDMVWRRYGLDGKRAHPTATIAPDRDVNGDAFVEIVKLLDLKVNWWLYSEEPNKDAKTTAFRLQSIFRNKEEIRMVEGATLEQLLLIADDDAVNVLQTRLHMFVCPDTSVNETLKATAQNLHTRWRDEKWKTVVKEKSLTSEHIEQLSKGLDVDTALWDDEMTIPADALIVRRRHISDADELKVGRMLKADDEEAIVKQKFNVKMTNGKMHGLKPNEWCNDEVVNFYMKMLQEYNDEKHGFTSYYFNSFFIAKLLDDPKNKEYCFENVER
jgi:ASC-1-like (ASCH) protein